MRMIIGLAAVLALAGCGKPTASKDEAASGNTAAPAASPGDAAKTADMKLNPGEWEMTVEMGVPGMPSGMGNLLKTTTKTCITKEQAERPNGEVFSGKEQKGCTYQDFEASGGHIKGTLSCTGQGNVTLAMDGTYGGDAFDVATKIKAGGGGTSVAMETRTSGKRVGDCPAGEKS